MLPGIVEGYDGAVVVVVIPERAMPAWSANALPLMDTLTRRKSALAWLDTQALYASALPAGTAMTGEVSVLVWPWVIVPAVATNRPTPTAWSGSSTTLHGVLPPAVQPAGRP